MRKHHRVLVVAQHQLVARYVSQVLKTHPEIVLKDLVLSYNKVESARIPADTIWVVDCPREAEEFVERLVRAECARFCILIINDWQNPVIPTMLSLGVKGFVTYDLIEQQLPRAIYAVAGGGFWVIRHVLADFVDSVIRTGAPKGPDSRPVKDSAPRLKHREEEVLQLLGFTNKEIAQRLNIAEATVKFHVSKLLKRFQARSRTQLLLQLTNQHYPED